MHMKNIKATVNHVDSASQHQSAAEWKVRVNENITTAQVNKILDALDRNNGYCP